MWDCDVDLDGLPKQVILKAYPAGFADRSGLGPRGTARKSALALSELCRSGVWPRSTRRSCPGTGVVGGLSGS